MNNTAQNSSTFAAVILLLFGLAAAYWGFALVRGIFVPLLFAMIFAVIFYPMYEGLLKKTKMPIISSLIACFVLLLAILALISFAVYLAVGEVVGLTKLFTNSFDFQSIGFLTDQEQLKVFIDQTTLRINDLVQQIPFVDTSISAIFSQLLENIPPLLQQLSTYLIGLLRDGFAGATAALINLFIFFICFFFLLMDGKKFVAYTFKLLPINALHERQITKRFSNLCYSWIVVNLLLALLQGALAAIGFAIIGVPSPFIWGIITMFFSFIPVIGSAIIWGVMGIIYLILGQYGAAIFIILWGAIMISSSDNILRPFLLKEGIKIHPLILFVSILGGFYAFNVVGLVLGPLIVVFISTLLYIYQLEFGDILRHFHKTNKKSPKVETELPDAMH